MRHSSEKMIIKLVITITVRVLLLCALSFTFPIASAQIATPPEACPTVSQTTGRTIMRVTVPVSATYKVLSRLMVPDNQLTYSYWIQIDNNCAVQLGKEGIHANTWTWIDNKLTPQSETMMVFLAQGEHTVTLIGNGVGLKIDAVRFTTDLTCLPANVAGTCPTSTLTPTPALGDYNNDTNIDIKDYNRFVCEYPTGTCRDGSGTVLSSLSSDGNKNKVIDIGDFIIWLNIVLW